MAPWLAPLFLGGPKLKGRCKNQPKKNGRGRGWMREEVMLSPSFEGNNWDNNKNHNVALERDYFSHNKNQKHAVAVVDVREICVIWREHRGVIINHF